jgi:hypothetical protein
MNDKDVMRINVGDKDDGRVSMSSQVMGLNDNLVFMGRQLHVQTESTEFPVARIVTHVFTNGRILLSRKSEYPQDVQESRDPRKIRELMQIQHHQIIQEIAEKQNRIKCET